MSDSANYGRMLARAECLLLLLTECFAARSSAVDFKSLYETHEFFKLRDAVETNKAAAFYNAAVTCAFSGGKPCQRAVARFLRSGADSEQTCQARGLLLYASLREGDFRFAREEWQRILAAKCIATGNVASIVRAFSQFPQLSVRQRRASVLRYEVEEGNLFIPVSVNGRHAAYMLDTGANFSMLSESEAERLGIKLFDVADVHFGDATGNGVVVKRVGIADRLIAGDIELRNVPFVVIADDGPIGQLPRAKRGALGIQTLLAFQSIRWNRTGTVQLAFEERRKKLSRANLCFDGLDLAAAIGFGDSMLYTHMDTGSADTQLWFRFAREFAGLLGSDKGSVQITGGGGSIETEVVKLPKLSLHIGSLKSELSPAEVLLSEVGPSWFHARIGLDLLNQAREVTLDLKSMLLTASF